jgi:hypothetical protein
LKNLLSQLPRLYQIRILCLTLYLIKALFGFLLAIPFFLTTNGFLAPSPLSRSLLSEWDMTVLLHLLSGRGNILTVLIITILAASGIYIVIMQFINGGLYYVAVSGHTRSLDWKTFYAECGLNFVTHLKITLFMLIVYVVLVPAGHFFAGMLANLAGGLSGASVVITEMGKLALLMLILTLASIFSDTVRAAATAFPGKTMIETIKSARDYFKINILKLTGIFFATYLAFIIIWLIVEWISLKLTGLHLGILGVFIEFALFQVSSATRTGQKCWYLIKIGRDFKAQLPGRFLPEQAELPLGGLESRSN